ncbi:MAG: ABC transporter substrate-binding protein [Methylacidiphilales bacterium]|nr:ABC transporter substrate-binding protein [Candidatus Methylacidiphilales bacterium]
MAVDPGGLDLQTSLVLNGSWFGHLIYDNLVYLDNKGNIQPWLAKSWTISPDGKTYTFYLRDDVTFSDGTPFDAEAVRVNLARIRDPATKSPLATAMIAPYVDGKVIDKYTFQANLREPYSPFLYVLAQSPMGLVSPRQIEEAPKSLQEKPIGTGPFVVEKYTRLQGVTFVRREDYHWAPPFIQHDGPAYLQRIEVSFIPEAMVRYASLDADQFDLTMDAPPQDAAVIRANPNLVLASRIMAGNPMRGPTLNTQREPFNDVRVRRALACAIDREGITRMMGFGEYQPKTDFLASNTPYYDPTAQGILHYDMAEANRLLDEAGWTGRDSSGYRTKDGKRLTAEVLMTQSATPSLVIIAIQSDARKIGMEITLAEMPNAQRLIHRDQGTYQILGNYTAHTNTADGLYLYYHSKQIISDKLIGQNLTRLQDPELDDLLDRARQSTDPVVLKALYSQAQHRLVELVPTIPLYENEILIAYQKYVRGVLYDTSDSWPLLTAAWLDKERS